MKFTHPHQRPAAIVPDFDGIHPELRAVPQWVMWKYLWKSEEKVWSKPPLTVQGSFASSTDPTTWSNFQTVLATYESNRGRYDGIGLVLTQDLGLIGIDLDNMVTRDASGRYVLSKWAERVLELCPGYAEISPSGTGLRIVVKGTLPAACKAGQTEFYSTMRYLTMTGFIYESPDELPDCTEAVKYIVERIRPADKKKPETPPPAPNPLMDTQGLLQRAFASANGATIQSLFYGNKSGYLNADGQPDDSAADLGLCSLLSFWSKGDRKTLDDMFRQSALYRRKWDERHAGDGRTYGEMTIEKAMDGCTEFFGNKPLAPPKKTIDRVPEPEQIRSRIIDISLLADSANIIRKQPLNSGVGMFLPELSELYRPTLGRMTIVTGVPSHGKTTVVTEMVRHCVNAHGWKTGVASFETRPIEKFLFNLNRSEVGKPSYQNAFREEMTDEEHYASSRRWAGKIYTFDVAEEDMHMDGILIYLDEAIRNHNVNSFVLDPWSDLQIPSHLKSSYTHFVRESLNKLRRFNQTRNIHTWLIVHPTKMVTKDHTIVKPTLYSIADSAEFYNKADYGIVVHKDDPASTLVGVHVDKVKFDETGRVGVCYAEFDIATGRYTASSAAPPAEKNYSRKTMLRRGSEEESSRWEYEYT